MPIIISLVSGAIGAATALYYCFNDPTDSDEVLDAVQNATSNPDCLAEECIDFNHDVQRLHVSARNMARTVVDNDIVESGPPPESTDIVPYQQRQSLATKVFVVKQDVIEVEKHRRLNRRRRGEYIGSVVSDIKNRLGCPTDNAANRLAVRRMANNIMNKHGVRPTHIRSTIEVVISGVFIPDNEDILAAAIDNSLIAATQKRRLRSAGPQSWTDRIRGMFGGVDTNQYRP